MLGEEELLVRKENRLGNAFAKQHLSTLIGESVAIVVDEVVLLLLKLIAEGISD